MRTELKTRIPQVGAPDPELRTSPIIDEAEYDEHEASPDLELEAPVCYFNDEAFPLRAYVQSGAEVLQCTERGVWMRVGEKRPD
jgi:hypothetical protein